MKKIGFLFGAGAEGIGQIGMSSGAEFKRGILKNHNVKNIYEKINLEGKKVFKQILASNKSSILYQTLVEHKKTNYIEYEKIIDLIKKILGETNEYPIDETIEKYLEWKNQTRDKEENIDTKFKDIYKKLHEKIFKEESCEHCNSLLEYINYYSYIDSLFNHLRQPEIYPKEVEKVMQIYFAAYITILSDIKKISKESNFNLQDFSVRKEIKEQINILQKKIIDNINNDNLYYKIIKEIVDKHKSIEFSFVTTNYTNFAESILFNGKLVNNESFTYLHGRLDYFESLKAKEIKKIDDFENEEIIFPYLLIQSGVKPIINRYQIDQFNKGFDSIFECDCLIVIGYGYNSDDDHIAAVIRERLASPNKKTFWFLYNNGKIPDELCAYYKIKGKGIFETKNCENLKIFLEELLETLVDNVDTNTK